MADRRRRRSRRDWRAASSAGRGGGHRVRWPGRRGAVRGRGRRDQGGVGRRDRERGGGGREPDDQGGGRQATVHVRRTIPRVRRGYHRAMTPERSAAGLLRAVGLLPDGPVVWGRPVPPTNAGVFVIELAEPRPSAPIELARIGKWVERVPELRLDGERPTSKAVAARLAAFWLPSRAGPLHRHDRALGQPAGGRDRGHGARRPPAVFRRPLAARPEDAGRGARLVGRDARRRGVRGRAARRVRRRDRRRRAGGPPRPGRGPAVREPAPGDRRAQGDRPDRIAAAGAGGAAAAADPRRRRCPTATPRARTARRPRSADGRRAKAATARAGGARPRQRRPRRRPPTPEVAPPVEGALTVEGADAAAGRARDADQGQAPRGDRPDPRRQGARRPQGERRLLARPARSSRSWRVGSRRIEARLRTAVIVDAAGGRRADRARVGGQRAHRRRGRGR